MKVLRAVDYEILRQLPVNGRIWTPLARKPLRLATIIDEKKFLDSGNLLIHHLTVFFEDWVHDWVWQGGKIRYFTRVAEGAADVVVAYSVETVEVGPDAMKALSCCGVKPARSGAG